jgi:hypothetical protein
MTTGCCWPLLAKLAGGIVTPKGKKFLVWFVTAQNQAALPAYQNRLIGDELHCDGDTGHRRDERIARTKESGEASLNTRPIVRNGRGFEGTIRLSRRIPSQRRERSILNGLSAAQKSRE